MSYRQEVHQLTLSVTALLANGAQVPASDLPYALAGRLSLLELLRTVEHDLAMKHAAVMELRRDLARQHNPTDAPLSDLLPRTANSANGEHWRAVARHAVLARHDWDQALPGTRPHDDARWPEITDVASFAESVTVLNRDIATSLTNAGRLEEAISIQASDEALTSAARYVLTVSVSRPQGDAGDVITLRNRAVLINLQPNAVPEALYRLASTIDSAQHLTPQHAALISRTLADLSLTTANTINGISHVAAQALRDLAELLAEVIRHARATQALIASDPRPLAQSRSIQKVLDQIKQRPHQLIPAVAQTIALRIPRVTRSLSGVAHRELRGPNWLVALSEDSEQAWRIARLGDKVPLIRDLDRAAAQATMLDRGHNWDKSKGLTPASAPRALLSPHIWRPPPLAPAPAPTTASRRGPYRTKGHGR